MPPVRLELLQRMPVFGAIRDDALRLLLEHARVREAVRGDYFFHQNEPADSMFVLEHGRVAIVRRWKDEQIVLQHLGAGDCFGEMALMDLGTRSASVVAEEECVAIEIGAAELLHLYEHDVEQFALIQMNIGREVCRRLRAIDERLFQERLDRSPLAVEILFRAGPD